MPATRSSPGSRDKIAKVCGRNDELETTGNDSTPAAQSNRGASQDRITVLKSGFSESRTSLRTAISQREVRLTKLSRTSAEHKPTASG